VDPGVRRDDEAATAEGKTQKKIKNPIFPIN
jgi:hypothetical protein